MSAKKTIEFLQKHLARAEEDQARIVKKTEDYPETAKAARVQERSAATRKVSQIKSLIADQEKFL